MTHTRESTPYGPDYCRECSEAADEWVQWPCKNGLGPPGATTPAGPDQHLVSGRGRASRA
jgi:hypothetical protein